MKINSQLIYVKNNEQNTMHDHTATYKQQPLNNWLSNLGQAHTEYSDV